MATFQTTCPGCKATYKVDDSHLGRNARCAKCGARFKITTIASGAAPSASTNESASKPPSPAAAGPSEEANVPAQWNVGDVILDLYEVTGVLGEGGMGKVYKVHHRGWNMDLAVKCPKPDFFHTDRQKENFVAECETWIKLGLHPHIVSCHYVRTLGGMPRVFAEYVEGGTLKDWITSGKLYEGGPEKALERILDIAIQFAWGLHYAHEHEEKLIHQDVKPANVMMTPDGIAKVTDFGLAKARAAAGEVSTGGRQQSILVSSGGMTPAYCSPEQANNERLSRKTDIWSWGLSVLEMFTGGVTWMSGVAALEALESYLAMGTAEKPIAKMHDALAELLRRCFRKNPDDRPKDMQEIADRLRELYQETTKEEYPREQPEAADLLADGLNNQAVTMFDLGQKEEAEKLYEQALKADPHHAEAMYNRGLILWRSARIRDDELVRQLEEVCTTHPQDWHDKYLLGLVHLERGDYESAVEVLEGAEKKAPHEEAVQSALRTARDSQAPPTPRAFEGHTEPVESVCISPDGHLAVSGSWDKTVRLWELATGRCVRTFDGHTHAVTSVCISPDGRLALSGSYDKTLRLWELATGRCARTLEGHTDTVGSVCISPDGRLALSGSYDKTLRLWELATGRCLRTDRGHDDYVNAVSISPDSRFALSGGYDKSLRLWELATGRWLRALQGPTGKVTSVSISPDGRLALSGDINNMVRLWELATGRCVRTFEGHTDAVETVCISPDGRLALSGSRDETLRLWELATGRSLRTFQGSTGGVTSVSISPDGRCALSGSCPDKANRPSGLRLRLWKLNRTVGAPAAVALPRSSSEITRVSQVVLEALNAACRALEDDRPTEAIGEISRARRIPGYHRHAELLVLWRRAGCSGRARGFEGGWCRQMFEGHTRPVGSVCIGPDGRFALSGSYDGTLPLWELASGRCVRTLRGSASSVSISPDGRLAFSGSDDKTLRLWELPSGHCVRTFEGHTYTVHSVSISPDSRFALSGSRDDTLRLWELATGRCLRTLSGHTDEVHSVSFAPDGRFALSGSWDKTLRLWELATGRCARAFQGHTDRVNSVAFSPDGRSCLSGSADKTLRLWDASTGRCVRTFEGHAGCVTSVAFSPDGRFGLSGSIDKTMRLWALSTNCCLRTFQGHSLSVGCVAIGPDGRFAVSGSRDKTVRVWELVWEYEFPASADWDDGVRPYLETFLTVRCRCGDAGLTRVGKPRWNDEDFQKLLKELQYRGYGWLRPEGVRRELEKMTREWTAPPPLPWER